MPNKFYKVLEQCCVLDDIHDFENHTQDDVEMNKSQSGFLLELMMLWVIRQHNLTSVINPPAEVANVYQILSDVDNLY
jgi:hypothetical protein